MTRWIGLALLALAAAAGAEPDLKIVAADRQNEVERKLQLEFGPGELSEIVVTELKAEPAALVQAIGDPKNKTLTIKFKGIEKAGKYTANFKVQGFFSNSTATKVVAGEVDVVVGTPPQVDVSTKTLKFTGADCGSCWLASWFAPEILKRSATIDVTNKSPYPVMIRHVFQPTGIAASSWNAQSLSFRDIGNAGTVDPLRTSTFIVELPKPELLPGPGQYTGRLLVGAHVPGVPPFFAVSDGKLAIVNEAVHSVDVEVRLRDGVGLALFVAFAGVLFGRVLQAMDTTAYRQRMALLVRLRAMARGIEALPDPPRLEGLLVQIRLQEAGADTAAIDSLAAEVGKLENLFLEGRKLCLTLAEVQKKNPQHEVVKQVEDALAAINVEQSAAKVEAALRAAFTVLTAKPPGAIESEGRTPDFGQMRTVGRVVSKVGRTLAAIAGTEAPPVGFAISVLQPLATITLVVVLTIYGVWLVYGGDADAAQTFGSAGVAAYVSLFLWGLTAQVVGKTLQTLAFART